MLIQSRNYKIMWLILTDQDVISTTDGHSFSIDPLLSITYQDIIIYLSE